MTPLGRDVLLTLALAGGGLALTYRFGGAMDRGAGMPSAAHPLPGASPEHTAACPFVRLQFASGGRRQRVTGRIAAAGAEARLDVVPRPGESTLDARREGRGVFVSLTTRPDRPAEVVLVAPPESGALLWEFFLDDAPLEASHVFGGPWGLAAPDWLGGLRTAEDRFRARADVPPRVDARHEVGVFVTTACSVGTDAP